MTSCCRLFVGALLVVAADVQAEIRFTSFSEAEELSCALKIGAGVENVLLNAQLVGITNQGNGGTFYPATVTFPTTSDVSSQQFGSITFPVVQMGGLATNPVESTAAAVQDDQVVIFDVDSGDQLSAVNLNGLSVSNLAFDFSTNKLYGQYWGANLEGIERRNSVKQSARQLLQGDEDTADEEIGKEGQTPASLNEEDRVQQDHTDEELQEKVEEQEEQNPTNGGTGESKEYLVEIDYTSGELKKVATIDLLYKLAGTRAIDYFQSIFYTISADADTGTLLGISLSTGQEVVRQPLSRSIANSGMFFDGATSTLMALCRAFDGSVDFALCSINPSTGVAAAVSATAKRIPAIKVAENAFDSANRLFFLQDASNAIAVLDATSGEQVASFPTADNFVSLTVHPQCECCVVDDDDGRRRSNADFELCSAVEAQDSASHQVGPIMSRSVAVLLAAISVLYASV